MTTPNDVSDEALRKLCDAENTSAHAADLDFELAKRVRDLTARRCREACEAQYLDDPQPGEGDRAYDLAIGDCVHVILKLFPGAAETKEAEDGQG